MTPQEVADLLRVSLRTVRTWIRTGQLEASRLGHRTYRVSRAQLRHFLATKAPDL